LQAIGIFSSGFATFGMRLVTTTANWPNAALPEQATSLPEFDLQAVILQALKPTRHLAALHPSTRFS
jgi:hypothetical protein